MRYGLCILVLALGGIACGGGQQTVEATIGPEPEPAPEPVVATADPTDVHIEGDHLTIDRHINFAVDSDEILGDSYELLDHIALMISNHTDEVSHLKIIGHTDAAGGHAHNMDLSNRRAAAVENALRERGVTIVLEHDGVGETEPVCSEDTDDCHAQNRRVEFLIVTDDAI